MSWKHIKKSHIENPPESRGKGMTTWWPVIFTANGIPTMSEQNVIDMIMEAVADPNTIWQNAPRDTRLAIYEVPEEQAVTYGVSEVKVSVTPDGKILSAYPSAGSNVLAFKETQQPKDEQPAVVQPQENPLDVAAEMKQNRAASIEPDAAEDGWTA